MIRHDRLFVLVVANQAVQGALSRNTAINLNHLSIVFFMSAHREH
jgi:hypothetical protein